MITVHTDVVGSLLQPPELLEAQKRFASGEITLAQFKRVEDRAVDAALRLQEAAGLEVVTDGEMRRISFQSQMAAAATLRVTGKLCIDRKSLVFDFPGE